ncbi:MAG: hypothetical protein WBK76_01525 [Candidatus Saccharimonadales bacterium]
MNEHLTPEAINGTPEVEPETLNQTELDSFELYVRELLETGATDNDITAVINARLPQYGITPLAEGEDRKTVKFNNYDGETVEKTIVFAPRDFGTVVSNIEAQLMSGDAVEDFPIDRLRERLNDRADSPEMTSLGDQTEKDAATDTLEERLGHDAVQASDVSVENTAAAEEQLLDDAHEDEAEQEANQEDESTEQLNQESMQLARRKLNDLLEVSQTEQRVISPIMDELATNLSRGMLDIDSVVQDIQMVWQRMNQLVEESNTTMRAFISIESQLDTRSSSFKAESETLEQAAITVRRSLQQIEEDAVYPLRVLMGLSDEARFNLEAKQDLQRRIQHVTETVQSALSHQMRSLQEIEL